MDWRLYLTSEPAVADGHPVVRGTCLRVDFLLELLAEGWTHELPRPDS